MIMTPIIILIGVFFMRGGIQSKPLNFIDAKIFNHPYVNNLVLNSTFTVIRGLNKPPLQKVHYFSDKRYIDNLNQPTVQTVFLEQKNINIVLIVLERFSQEYTELRNPEVTPYLNRLRREGYSYTNSYANGRRSIEGLAAILAGVPALMEVPFISSEFSTHPPISLGYLLAAEGYHTSFFHGAKKRTMYFDGFIKSIGIQNHYSVEDYPEPSDHDGTWGIFDEPFLQWSCETINSFHQPFFSTLFTLTSHHPFAIPEAYQHRFTDDRAPILKSVQYTDYALQQFMACAEQQAWFQNTLFIITADHTGPALHPNTATAERYRIPIILYGPHLSGLNQLDTGQYAQQIDLVPSLLDSLQIRLPGVNYLARSLFREGNKLIALYDDGEMMLVGYVTDAEQQLKAVQHYFSDGLYHQRLYHSALQ